MPDFETIKREAEFDFAQWRRDYDARRSWMHGYIREVLKHGGSCSEILYSYAGEGKTSRLDRVMWTSTTIDHPDSPFPEGPRAHGRPLEALADHLSNRHFGFGWDLDVAPANYEHGAERYRAGELLPIAYVVDTHAGAMSQILVCPDCYARAWSNCPGEDVGVLTAPSLERLRELEQEPIDPGPRVLGPAPALPCEGCGKGM